MYAMACTGGFRGVCTPWHVPVGALGGARADVHGKQSGGFRGVCTPWRVPVGGMKTYDMLAPNDKIYNDILVFRHNISMYQCLIFQLLNVLMLKRLNAF